VECGGRWRRDAFVVRALSSLVDLVNAQPGQVAPARRAELLAVLAGARERLRRGLLAAEGVDPDTGRPSA
jgi:hypothetical protein